MTIEKEAPGVWMATCDGCQERVELDTDPDEDFLVAVAEVRALEWRIRKETRQFVGQQTMNETRPKYGPVWTHNCRDCSRKIVEREETPVVRDLELAMRESLPYRRGADAAAKGEDRDSNPVWSDRWRPVWFKGYDETLRYREQNK